MIENSVVPNENNLDTLQTNPVLAPDVAKYNMDLATSAGIDVDPVRNFTPQQKMDNELPVGAAATRKVANVSDSKSSLLKPDAKKLGTLESYIKNSKITLDIDSKRNQITEIVNKQISLRSQGQELDSEDLLNLDNLEIDIEDLATQRDQLGLNWVESAATGDFISVYKDFENAVKENPKTTALGLLGVIGGPAGLAKGLRVSTAAANAKYNFNRTYAQTYRDLENQVDSAGNKIDEQTKNGISMVSSVIQTGLEAVADVALIKTSQLFGAGKISKKIADYAMANPGFKGWIADFSSRAATQGVTEAFTEILQDNTGDFAKALGDTWTKAEGTDVIEAWGKFKKDYDVSKNIETGVRSFVDR